MANLLTPTLAQLVADAMSDPAWKFDPKSGRYRAPNGRFLSRDAVLKIVDTRIAAAQQAIDDLGQQLLDDRLTLPEWERQFAREVKALSLQAFIAGAGGVDRLVPADYLKLARQLKAEYKYLAEFAKAIAMGEVTPGQFQARARMYAAKGRAAFWAGRMVTAQRDGFTHMQRHLSPLAEHCPECPAYALAGPRPIGELPLPTEQCTCKSNCKCTVEFLRDPNA